eukprot:TRINITY_DN5431_c0_g2_i2.p1 TRINITY_DN5431_c0_g2~~TRINITY_DN5431_c0_g2_i2.p1  ORF type:complete len:112 (+),score=17.16 TRINITY_DN5431_c0_g2_i2:139-474(+)
MSPRWIKKAREEAREEETLCASLRSCAGTGSCALQSVFEAAEGGSYGSDEEVADEGAVAVSAVRLLSRKGNTEEIADADVCSCFVWPADTLLHSAPVLSESSVSSGSSLVT